MYLKKYSKWTVVAGTLLIWTVKFIIRPYIHVPQYFQLCVDVAPNFIGSYLLPFGACWFFQKYFRLQTLQQLQFACLFGLILVVIDEYIQLIPFFGRTFDYFDILFSFAGVFIGYKKFSRLMAKKPLHNIIAE